MTAVIETTLIAKAIDAAKALDTADAYRRARHFKVNILGEYQCPVCWVHHELHSDLKMTGRLKSGEEGLVCPHCSDRITIPSVDPYARNE